jgi:arsenate reductase
MTSLSTSKSLSGVFVEKIKVLFLCNHNSVRSQMAEGLLRHYYGEKYEVFSAGSTPTQVNPLAIQVMVEIGIDISGHRSKSIEEFQDKDIDLVVSVCQSSAKAICLFCASPLVQGRPEIITSILPKAKKYIHRPFKDPSEVEGSEEEKIAAFRKIRDEIKAWVIEDFRN